MGRPPCCDKVGIKKGPWTPEEDIILVSYIQEHGPGNWRSVPTNTGLLRCSKSCRLRWTNYLRPGIKRGNFTPHEEGMIIHLQALLGNKWAAIASYLPQRTDNDIKNYWNTHLKKKLKKFQAALDPHLSSSDSSTTTSHFLPKTFNVTRTSDISTSHGGSTTTTTATAATSYASSTENISRLLEGWMRSSPKPETKLVKEFQNDDVLEDKKKTAKSASMPAFESSYGEIKDEQEGGDRASHEEFDSILSFENLNVAWDKSTCDSTPEKISSEKDQAMAAERNKRRSENSSSNPPLSFLEKWLLDENVGQVEEMMELSSSMF